MRRRQVLMGGIPLLVVACGPSESDRGYVLLLNNTLPNQTLAQVNRQAGIPLRPRFLASRQALWNRIKGGSQASLALVGGDWWDPEFVQPVPASWLEAGWWREMDPRWQQVVTEAGQVWGIPWRWGTTAIGYRRDRVPFRIETWEDLWRPELRGRLTLPDHPQEVIDLVMRVLQTKDLQHPDLLDRLRALHEQVLLYTSQDYLPMLRIGDAWAAVGWSEDLWQAQRVDGRIEVVIVPSLIWWDAWMLPKTGGGDPEGLTRWLEELYHPQVVARAVQTSRINAVIPGMPSAPWLIPESVAAASTLSQRLSPDLRQAYWDLWQQVRLS